MVWNFFDINNDLLFLDLSKENYTSFIADYSFNVPVIEDRLNFLIFLINSDFSSQEWENKYQYCLGVMFSTFTVHELKNNSDVIASCLKNAYKKIENKNCYKFLDYVLSNDWGKLLLIINNLKDEFFHLIDNEYYYISDEFATLLIKIYSSEEGRRALQKKENSEIDELYFLKLIDSARGKSGGLIRQTGFILRGQKYRENGSAHSCSNLIKYIKIRNFDDLTAYYVIELACKALCYNKSEIIRDLTRLNYEKVVELFVLTKGFPYITLSDIQAKLINGNIKKYNFNYEIYKNHKEFYKINVLQNSNLEKVQREDKVGVIITTYNPQLELLELAIQSIAMQTYKNIEICLVDDGSNINIRAGIKGIVKKYNNIIYVENNKNIGQYACRNKAIEYLNNCHFFAIQDDDDISHPQRIATQIEMIKRNKGLLCMTQQVRFTSDMRYIPDLITPLQFDYGPATSLFTASLVKEIGGFAQVRSRGDVEFLRRITRKYGEEKIVKIDLPLYIMRYANDTVSASKDFYLKTQLNVFRFLMRKGNPIAYYNGQQHALNG